MKARIFAVLLVTLIANPALAAKTLESRIGKASFYAEEFHGLRTASGEIFDMTKLVAAHPSYPFGTVVRVTNLENDKAVRLRVTDRGPTEKYQNEGRIIDVSRGAAEKLNFVEDGVAAVRVEVLAWGNGRYRAE